jgi:Ribonuclease G/E
MTRKRTGKTLIQQLTQSCSVCHGRGVIRSLFMISNTVLQNLKLSLLESTKGAKVTLTIHPDLFEHLVNIEYNSILSLEKQFQCTITLVSSPHVARESSQVHIKT